MNCDMVVALKIRRFMGSVTEDGRNRTYRPTSYAGEARGDSSATMVNIPSNLRSGNGAVTSADMRAIIL